MSKIFLRHTLTKKNILDIFWLLYLYTFSLYENASLYTNARMQLIMSITSYTVISIENLLFGSDNLTDENNLIVIRNVHKYIHHSNRFDWYEIIPCTQYVIIYLHSIPFSPLFSHYFCLSNIFMYTFIILCKLLSFSYLCI